MPRRCVAAGCNSVDGKIDCSFHKFPPDEAIRKRWIKAVKQQRSNWNGPSIYSLLCSKHFTNDCFQIEGIRFCDEVGLPTAKRLKPDAVPTIFTRSTDYLECSSVSSTSKTKPPTSWPLAKKQQQKSVGLPIAI